MKSIGSHRVTTECVYQAQILLIRPGSLAYPIAGYTKIETQPLEGGDVDA